MDGAFGLWAAASAPRRHLVAGIDRADSVATDAHKWLNVPYDCGVAFCAHPDAHRRAMSLSAAYIVESAAERDPHEFVPEESRRGARGARLRGARDARPRRPRRPRRAFVPPRPRMAERLSAHPSLRVLNDVVLNQVLVRVRQDATPTRSTRDIIARVQQDGTCWAGGTTWHGMAAMRISISNWSTTEADIDRSADAIVAATDAAVARSKA